MSICNNWICWLILKIFNSYDTPINAAIHLANYAKDLPDKNRDQVVSSLIKQKIGTKRLRDDPLQFNTHGSKLNILVNPSSNGSWEKLSYDMCESSPS